jgi:hypothetical protein
MSNRVISIVVDNREIEVDLDEELQVINVGDDQTKVAAQMAFWGEVWGAASKEKSEWKVRQIVESDKKFYEMKKTIAEAERNMTIASTMFEAFKSKAAVLSSKGAMDRAVFERTGMTTKSKAKTKKTKVRTMPTQESKEDSKAKKAKLAKILKKSK